MPRIPLFPTEDMTEDQRRVYDTCNTPILSGTTTLQVGSPEAVFCHQVFPLRPDVKALGSYALPHDIIVSATFRKVGGAPGGGLTPPWGASRFPATLRGRRGGDRSGAGRGRGGPHRSF